MEFYILKVSPLSSAYATETQKDVWQYSFSVTAAKSLKILVKELIFDYVCCPAVSSHMRKKTSIEAMQLNIVTISMKFLLD